MALVNHVLCSKEIKIIALVLNKTVLEKVEKDVPVVSKNNESEVTWKKRQWFWVVLQLRFHIYRRCIFMDVCSPF